VTARVANCPGCGAPVKFAWSSAVQTACPFCKAILVRHDLDLERVGEVADLPPDASPIQIGAEGKYDGRSFRVVGRIRYAWEQGEWNEWHIVFWDSKQPESGWLSDAQAQYAVSFPATEPVGLPTPENLMRGQFLDLWGSHYMVTHLTSARYEGFEGELPFRTTDRSESLFADLRTQDARFATIDYSEDTPLLFMGRQVELEELAMKGLREFEGW
jgi:hypothetical protein